MHTPTTQIYFRVSSRRKADYQPTHSRRRDFSDMPAFQYCHSMTAKIYIHLRDGINSGLSHLLADFTSKPKCSKGSFLPEPRRQSYVRLAFYRPYICFNHAIAAALSSVEGAIAILADTQKLFGEFKVLFVAVYPVPGGGIR